MAGMKDAATCGATDGAMCTAAQKMGGQFAQLGFGLMRLPEIEENGEPAIDIEAVKQMVDAFMAAGFTYFDTAYTYHRGTSEIAAREALVKRYPRESFQLATKLPAWAARDATHAQGMFDTSLERTGAGYFDYYLLHQLGGDLTAQFAEYGLWDLARQKRKEGLAKNLGFSFHGKADELDLLLTENPDMDFVQLQLNYADWENDIIQSRACYEAARAHDVPVIVMEPVKGGSLVKLPKAAEKVLLDAAPDAPVVSWALRFVASLPDVFMVLSGMSTMDQLEENMRIMRAAKSMSAAEQATINRVRAVLDSIPTVPCTDCKYCMKDCPEGIRIPTIMDSLDILAKFDDMHRAKENYVWNANGDASKCIQCGNCEARCPQHIDIIAQLERAAQLFED